MKYLMSAEWWNCLLYTSFRERFWVPEAFVSMFGQMAVIQMDDGTKPE